jgi:hypothetical protein
MYKNSGINKRGSLYWTFKHFLINFAMPVNFLSHLNSLYFIRMIIK